jgi:Protein of unknown function (DUF3800)
LHSFHAYIDEAGDEGFSFKDFPDKGSSEWFVIAASIVKETERLSASRALKVTLDPIEEKRKAPVHFAALPHDARVAIAHCLSRMPVTAVAIAINKRALAQHTLAGNRRLHFYAARYLLERISWIARDRSQGAGNGKCSLTFSHCKGLSYELLAEYFKTLQKQQTQVSWGHLDVERLKVRGHAESIWLRSADAIASGVAQGLELSRHGFCEDKYARLLRPIVYSVGLNYRSYGMKVFPQRPPIENERDNRYEWLSLY